MIKILGVLAALIIARPALPFETNLGAAFRTESDSFQDSCGDLKKLADCGELLFTGNPIHIAVGSLAPQNGFGAGLAFTAHYTPNEDWRLFWNADAVGTPNGSWRAGGYLSAVLIRHQQIKTRMGTAGIKSSKLTLEEMPVLHAYAQATSLNSISYYGLGPDTSPVPTYFGLSETIVGGNVIWPLGTFLKISLLGEANGRFYSVRGGQPANGTSIEQTNNNTSAPGLSDQPGFAQFSEGIRLRPSFIGGHARLNYTASFQEWVASNSTYSFRRLNANLTHQFPLYSKTRSLLPREFNGPDSCAASSNSLECPRVTRNLEGSFEFVFFYTASYVSDNSVVPFYLDPTIGGSDLNGTILLPSLPDYRFRGPNLLVFRGSFEHSIYKWPIGVKFMVDEGRVAMTPGDLGFSHLAHSYAAGLTVRAGGLPLVDLLFAWGGHEGTHTIANVSTTLLGGTSRPSLF
jgi:hypothetical protein